ncbi:MAG: DNA repair protein RecN [Lachnospiraceae bacterium]|nr:DNA repair protein RecN [Lachnospiraceae bacterium]
MLYHLHVKNLALIDEIEIDFHDHLNILTGETGAGKSIILGSINLALGAKASADMIRNGEEEALVELVFMVENQENIQKLKQLDVNIKEDGQVIISRKITEKRSICKINDETVTIGKLKEAASFLLDIHGQHEHQSLLKKEYHLEVLDRFAFSKDKTIKEQVALDMKQYEKCLMKWKELEQLKQERTRKMSFLEFEYKEIEEANLIPGEDISLEQEYKKMENAKEIMENLSGVYQATGYESGTAAGSQFSAALKKLSQISEYDSGLQDLYEQLLNLDNLLNDFNKEIKVYEDEFTFDEESYRDTEKRLYEINHLKSKYGDTIEGIIEYGKNAKEQYEKMLHIEEEANRLEVELERAKEVLAKSSEQLSKLRKKAAKELEESIVEALKDLNFMEVDFEIEFQERQEFSFNGKDEVIFTISTNAGERRRPIWEVASGGELSRIMLALKSVLADMDEIETLIFDEIDVGISGRTAQKVSERMAVISKHHQVMAITHLPQIAAMADYHFLIEKSAEKGKTITNIQLLKEEEQIKELARMLSGVSITDTVIESAKEMKKLAQKTKSN